jgi:hypothetical protein
MVYKNATSMQETSRYLTQVFRELIICYPLGHLKNIVCAKIYSTETRASVYISLLYILAHTVYMQVKLHAVYKKVMSLILEVTVR